MDGAGGALPASADAVWLIGDPEDDCATCWGCARLCPVKAIRALEDRPTIIREKCVACGLCVAECGPTARLVRDDLPTVRTLLAGERPVVALLATEFIAAMHPMTASGVEHALAGLGFRSVETTLLGEELVAGAYRMLHQRDDLLLTVRSTCPVVVGFVEKYYPGLTSALAPIMPPYIAQAQLIRATYEEDCAIVYVGPCFARKDEYRDPQFEQAVDVAIDFLELKRLIAGGVDTPRLPTADAWRERPAVVKELSLTDGFPRETLTGRSAVDPALRAVRGLAQLGELLDAVVAGEASPRIIDALNCEGCIDGPAVSPGLSLFAKRNIEVSARGAAATTHVSTRAMLAALPAIDVRRSFAAAPVRLPMPSAAEIDGVLAQGRLSRQTAPNCGACGWSTCEAHALAICRGESTWGLCLPLQRELAAERELLVQQQRDRLADAETIDPLTRVWNSRATADRLQLEVARHARYHSPLAVMLIDLDDFGALNETLSEAVGDAVLTAVAGRLAAQVRATDFLGRRMGDQFLLILPGITKTAAFAVAEKLRLALRAPLEIDAPGYTGEVSVTASMGVASAQAHEGGVAALLESADGALHEAMDAGKDRVCLAAG